MSIILEGIDMPKDDDMSITITKDGRIYWDNKYHMIAQAIQINRPHGRLIDEKIIKENSIDDGYDLYVSWTGIDNAPTILEAEE